MPPTPVVWAEQNPYFHPEANERHSQLIEPQLLATTYSSYTNDSVTVINRSSKTIHLETVHRSVAKVPPNNRFKLICKKVNQIFATAHTRQIDDKHELNDPLLCGDLLTLRSEGEE